VRRGVAMSVGVVEEQLKKGFGNRVGLSILIQIPGSWHPRASEPLSFLS
jgi:hypothetical protein